MNHSERIAVLKEIAKYAKPFERVMILLMAVIYVKCVKISIIVRI
jgi:hypothetical protein